MCASEENLHHKSIKSVINYSAKINGACVDINLKTHNDKIMYKKL